MRIVKLVIGTVGSAGPVARTYALNADLSVIVVDDPEVYARAVRDTLTAPRRAGASIPFVSIEMAHDDLLLTVADDASSGVRMMTRGRARAIPEILEVHTSDPEAVIDGGLDTIFAAVAHAAGADDIETLAPALAIVDAPTPDATRRAEASAFLEASARARQLAAAVRAVDDEMTASVVPDWLWIATGVGGLGVFCTALAFLYPELRVVLVMTLVALSVVGFSLYGWRALHEMKTRGRLQEERAALRQRREAAREEARTLAERLRAEGEDVDRLLLANQDAPLPRAAPAIVVGDGADLDALASAGRQIIAFVTSSAPATPHVVDPE